MRRNAGRENGVETDFTLAHRAGISILTPLTAEGIAWSESYLPSESRTDASFRLEQMYADYIADRIQDDCLSIQETLYD